MQGRTLARRRTVGGLLAALAFVGTAHTQTPDKNVEVAIDVLSRAFTPVRGGSHLPLITSLRQLRDPALAPFLGRLLDSEDWQLRAHAVMGLAELDPDGVIDIALMGSIGPDCQESIIAFGLDEGRLDDEARLGLIAWTGLEPWPRLMLLAEIAPLDDEARAQAATLVDHEDIRIATLATIMSAADQGAVDLGPMITRLAALDDRSWAEAVAWIYEAARQFEYQGFGKLILATLDDPRLPRSTGDAGLTALLQIDPVTGARAWEAALAEATRYGRRVRLGIALLAAGTETAQRIQPELIDEYDTGERLIAHIAAALRAQQSGIALEVVEAACAMLQTEHSAAMAWTLSRARRMPSVDAVKIYACALTLFDKPEDERVPSDVNIAAEAALGMLEFAPDAVLGRLATVPDDGIEQELLLTSMFESRDPRVFDAVAALPRGTRSRADSLVLLLLARDRTLEAADLQRLAMAAAGGGSLIPPLAVQAAWLYLQQTGNLDVALETILPREGLP